MEKNMEKKRYIYIQRQSGHREINKEKVRNSKRGRDRDKMAKRDKQRHKGTKRYTQAQRERDKNKGRKRN